MTSRLKKGEDSMFKARVTKTIVAVVLTLTMLIGSSTGVFSSSKKLNLTVLGGTVGGMWYVIAGGLSEILKEKLPEGTISVEPGGGSSNVSLISSGEAHLGLANACSLYDGWHGAEPFGTPQTGIRAIAALFPQMLHIFVLKESGIREVEDLQSKVFTPSNPGQTTYTMAEQVLEEHGIPFSEVPKAGGRVAVVSSLGDAVDRMKDKHIDAIFWVSPPAHPSFADLASARDIDVIGIREEMIDRIMSKYPMYSRLVIPAGSYRGQTRDAVTLGTMTVLAVNADVPDDVVYEITKTIFDELDRVIDIYPSQLSYLSPESAYKDVMIPLHPGAEKYYREIGVIE